VQRVNLDRIRCLCKSSDLEHVDASLKISYTGLERVVTGVDRLLEEHIVESKARDLRHAADAIIETQLPKSFILVLSEAETDHSAPGFHSRNSSARGVPYILALVLLLRSRLPHIMRLQPLFLLKALVARPRRDWHDPFSIYLQCN
jgi:hypothetical protein